MKRPPATLAALNPLKSVFLKTDLMWKWARSFAGIWVSRAGGWKSLQRSQQVQHRSGQANSRWQLLPPRVVRGRHQPVENAHQAAAGRFTHCFPLGKAAGSSWQEQSSLHTLLTHPKEKGGVCTLVYKGAATLEGIFLPLLWSHWPPGAIQDYCHLCKQQNFLISVRINWVGGVRNCTGNIL